jgi:hypothetical protein
LWSRPSSPRPVFDEVESTLDLRKPSDHDAVRAKLEVLKEVSFELYEQQSVRIRDDIPKTRLSILFYAIVGNAVMLSRQTVRLLGVFDESFRSVSQEEGNDLD